MTGKKFPKIPPASAERKTLRLPEQPPPRVKLPSLSDTAKTKPTLARRRPALRDEGGLLREEPEFVVPPARVRLGEPPSEQPPRLGGLPPEQPRLAGQPLEAKELARRIRQKAQNKQK